METTASLKSTLALFSNQALLIFLPLAQVTRLLAQCLSQFDLKSIPSSFSRFQHTGKNA
jgi:hypothetical protein